MPSSMIFVGLVVLWLLILVPAVARRQQEVVRPSPAALSGRVLERPARHRTLEVYGMDEADETRAATRTEQMVEETPIPEARTPSRTWEQPAGFRPGRGGFDAEAAALAAKARYAFRQRVVLTLLILAVVTGVAAALISPVVWWAHGLVDVVLVGYLVYLRRQVRLEEAIRARRAARMAGTRRPEREASAEPAADEWADAEPDDGEEAGLHSEAPDAGRDGPDDLDDPGDDEIADEDPRDDDPRDDSGDEDHETSAGRDPERTESADGEDDDDWTADDGAPDRVRGTGEPVGVLPARRRSVRPDDDADAEVESALPPLDSAPIPPPPAGTQLVDVDEDDEELTPAPSAYRRAAGQ